MNTRNTTDRTGARATRVAASSLLALSALSVGVGSTLAAGGSGAIWTTDADCDAPAAQNRNLYAVGQTIYVRGENFDASAPLNWSIEGKPGGASGDPEWVVASGSATTDGDGAFCLDLYEVAPDDWGVYSVDVTQGRTSKNDNYRVDGAGDSSDETTDPGEDTTDPGDQTTDPVDETTDPGDDSTPTDESATESPADQTPADELPADSPRDEPGECTCFGEPADGDTNNPATPPNNPATTPTQSVLDATSDSPVRSGVTPLTQAVLGEVSTGGSIALPPTDTISDAGTDGSSILVILGLAGLAAAAVVLAPIRRRDPEATE